jgi:subtilisin family serine protease
MRFIIDFKNDATQKAINAYLKANGLTISATFDQLGHVYLVEADEMPPMADCLEAVIADEDNGIKLLDHEVVIRPQSAMKSAADTGNDDNWWKIAVVSGIDYDSDEYQTLRVGEGVRVYLLDSGIDVSHPDFASKDITLLHSLNSTFDDTTGHGTALASLIVGEDCGLTEASLKIVKIFHSGTTTYISNLLAAFNAVANDYASDPSKPAVLSLSWSISKNTYIEDKIAMLMSMGIIVSAAAGNSGQPVADVTPAGMASVMTVGAFNMDLEPSDFSNYTGEHDTSLTEGATNFGPGLDLFAPGEHMRVALPGGAFGYTAGTSAAAAVYSAVLVAAISRVNPSFNMPRGNDQLIEFVIGNSLTNNLLTLAAPYDSSPNVTPVAHIMAVSDDNVDSRLAPTPVAVFKLGEAFAIRLFDYNAFDSASITGAPTDWTLDGNWLVGTAPSEIEGKWLRQDIEVVLSTSDGYSTTYTLYAIVWDDGEYENYKDALEEADLTFHGYCCDIYGLTGYWCCGTCNKDGCNTGAGGCASSPGACA